MFMIESLDQVPIELSRVFDERFRNQRIEDHREALRAPVALFLIRDDGAGGSKLAQEVVGSYEYWHERTGHWFDAVFLGWGFDAGAPAFGTLQFAKCVAALEDRLKWKSTGEAQMILADFVFRPGAGPGHLDFSQAIPLDLSELLAEKKLRQLSPLVEDLMAPAKAAAGEGDVGTWQVSDYIAQLRTRRFLWKTFVRRVGALLGWVDEVAPYAVRDLRKN